tara:strand:+ start:305 stop:556 length:252 start_codon:yes stop_codon:yes gene_type:complete
MSEIIIATAFILYGLWVYYEVKNSPLLPDDYDWEDDPDVIDFLEQTDKPGSWDKKHDKSFTVGGLTNDKEGDFIKFQKKQNKK